MGFDETKANLDFILVGLKRARTAFLSASQECLDFRNDLLALSEAEKSSVKSMMAAGGGDLQSRLEAMQTLMDVAQFVNSRLS